MRVLLVNPPSLEPVAARISTPPLGLAYLSASLKASSIRTSIVDADALEMSPEQLARAAQRLEPDLIGVTAMTPTAAAAYRALEFLRPLAPVLALGGPHASALGGKVFEQCPVRLDYVVCGEAEQSFADLAHALASGEATRIAEIPGVLASGSEGAVRAWPKVQDLDSLPFPDRGALPFARYRHPLFANETVTSMITSRGCPYHCIFCDKHTCGSKWRARSAENVLEEMELILKSGIRHVIIYDDLFTLSRGRVIEICKRIIARGLEIKWKCEGRVNRVDPEMLSWMRRAGCEMIAYGVETATAHGLAFLRKDVSVEQVREAFAMTRAAGLQSLGYFLLGIPGETMEDEEKTVRLAIELKSDYAQFGVLSPLPGTPLHDYAKERGWVRELPARGPAERGSRRPVILDGYWTPERLERMVRRAHRKFYFRPAYLVGRLKRTRSARQLISGAVQGLRLAAWWISSVVKAAIQRAALTGMNNHKTALSSRPRVCYFGTFSRGEDYPRNNAVIRGLQAIGVEVLLCHADLWSTHEEKMEGIKKRIWHQAWLYLKTYARLAARYLATPDHEVVLVGYIGHIDMFPARILAGLRRKPIVFDAFYSLYETVVEDRGLYDADSYRARLLRLVDRWSCRLADLVLLDTWAHVDYFCGEFGLERSLFLSIPPGIEEETFHPYPEPAKDGVFDVISYSSYIPLHGIDVQVRAAALLRAEEDIRFTFVGKGQMYEAVRLQAENLGLSNVNFIGEWLSLSELVPLIARSDVCLGIFGNTPKAARVIPYKVYMALAMQKPVITGDCAAARELLEDGVSALLCPRGDADALARRIMELRDNAALRRQIASAGRKLFVEKCTSEKMAAALMGEMTRRGLLRGAGLPCFEGRASAK